MQEWVGVESGAEVLEGVGHVPTVLAVEALYAEGWEGVGQCAWEWVVGAQDELGRVVAAVAGLFVSPETEQVGLAGALGQVAFAEKLRACLQEEGQAWTSMEQHHLCGTLVMSGTPAQMPGRFPYDSWPL